MYKKLSASGGLRPPDSPPGALPLDPAGGSVPRPPFRLALHALAMVPLWQILDPPLAHQMVNPALHLARTDVYQNTTVRFSEVKIKGCGQKCSSLLFKVSLPHLAVRQIFGYHKLFSHDIRLRQKMSAWWRLFALSGCFLVLLVLK